jgi:hypothetical protein
MGDAYGWTDNGRQVFDPLRLEKAAADLRSQNSAQQLKQMLADSLAPRDAFGRIPTAGGASQRLQQAFEAMSAQLEKVGIDLSDLASRSLAAAQLAAEVDPVTQAAARRGQSRAI